MYVINAFEDIALNTLTESSGTSVLNIQDRNSAIFSDQNRDLIDLTSVSSLLAPTFESQYTTGETIEDNRITLGSTSSRFQPPSYTQSSRADYDESSDAIIFSFAGELTRFVTASNAITSSAGNNRFILRTPQVITVGTQTIVAGSNLAGAVRTVTPLIDEIQLDPNNDRILRFWSTNTDSRVNQPFGSTSITGGNVTFTDGDRITATAYTYVDPANDTRNRRIIHPADRCTWEFNERSDGEGYEIHNAKFYAGVNVGTGSNTHFIQLLNAQLGYICKSGRFVKIAD